MWRQLNGPPGSEEDSPSIVSVVWAAEDRKYDRQ